jgi:hypothetical protein
VSSPRRDRIRSLDTTVIAFVAGIAVALLGMLVVRPLLDAEPRSPVPAIEVDDRRAEPRGKRRAALRRKRAAARRGRVRERGTSGTEPSTGSFAPPPPPAPAARPAPPPPVSDDDGDDADDTDDGAEDDDGVGDD